MTDKPKNPIEADTQPAYDPPQALRMGDIHAGTGGIGCYPTGSGDTSCEAGNTATNTCYGDGNTAGTICSGNGNDAGSGCLGAGNNV